MTPERWAQLNRLFHDAMNREPQGRRTFLESACGDDKSLFRHLQSLIAAHEKSPEFFENAASELAAELLGGDLAVVSGQTIGPYRVIDLLGVGGMGEVYLRVTSTHQSNFSNSSAKRSARIGRIAIKRCAN